MTNRTSGKHASDPIRFILDGKIQTLSDVDPSLTILQYLREKNARTGTKEACGQGGCGACTVVLADLDDSGQLRYRTINACLHLLPQLDGQALLTVEDMKSANGPLHPVQQALIDNHASQCGYCTPGIVMTLFALYQSGEPQDRASIVNALAGNLCRCTGYRPVIDAALSVLPSQALPLVRSEQRTSFPSPASHVSGDGHPNLPALLASIQRTRQLALQSLTSMGNTIRYLVPVDLKNLSDMLLQYPGAVLFAGGTDIGALIAQERQYADPVIFIGRIKELRGIRVSDSHLTIGAATTLTEAYPVIARYYPAFGELLLRFGSPAIRNVATIGGSLASRSPVSDTAPAFMALNGQVKLVTGGEQRMESIETFYTRDQQKVFAPGEFIESITLPLPQKDNQFAAYKVSKRQDCDIAAITAAFYLELQDQTVHTIRLCYGGAAPSVIRARHCERALAGQPWTRETIEKASEALEKDLNPASDERASAAYRRLVAKNLLRRWYLESLHPPEFLRVAAYRQTND